MSIVSKEVLESIDKAALVFYYDKTEKNFEKFIKHAAPLITSFSNRTCSGSSWDNEELYSILLQDMWRLLNVWVPDEKYKFHYLILRQLKNKCINFVKKENRVLRSCTVCGVRNLTRGKTCTECGSELLLSSTTVSYETMSYFQDTYASNHCADTELEKKDLVSKLISEISDQMTKRIVVLYLRGNTVSEIEKKLNLKSGTANRKIRDCKKIVKTLTRDKVV